MTRNRRYKSGNNRYSITFPFLAIVGIGMIFSLSSFYEKSWSYNWNGIRLQIKDSIKASESNAIQSRRVGIAGTKSKQFERVKWIMENATESELLQLLEYPNGTVKTIAYEGLLRKTSFIDKYNLIMKVLNDTEYTVDYQIGCVQRSMYIREYISENVFYLHFDKYYDIDSLSKSLSLSKSELEKILIEYNTRPKLWD